jgi:hypothetical protein
MLRYLNKAVKNQRGNISPFMIGLVMGLAVFSTSMRKQAEYELAKIQQQQADAQARQLEELKAGIENALLMETAATFNTALDANRIRSNTSAKLQTRTGQNVVINTTAMDAGTGRQRVMISTSDDAFVRADAGTMTDANMLTNAISQRDDVAMIDTSAIRTRQLETSRNNMEMISSIVYNWWANRPPGTQRFPTPAEYNAQIRDVVNARTFWDTHFTYTRPTNHTATLSFTTPAPWSETHTINLSMVETAAALNLP